MSTTLERIEETMDTDNPSDMVHLAEEDSLIALCGAKLKGIDADALEVDCVVCVEIDHHLRELGL